MNKEEMARELSIIKKTGSVNMIDRYGVIRVLNELKFYETATYAAASISNYVEILKLSEKY